MKQSDKQCKQRRGFTLVELMVVIVIIAVILGITAPAFQKLATGNAVDSAARMVSSQLSLARAEAISRRQHVAVIMPAHGYRRESDDKNVYPFQSFRAAIVESNGSGGYTFEQWVEGTEWTFLPTGAAIASVSETENALRSVLKDPSDPSSTVIIPKEPNDWSPSYSENASPVTDAATPKSDNKFMNGGNASADNNGAVRAVIFKPNGRCTQKLFLTVIEGIYNEATLNDTSQTTPERTVKTNIRVMEINAYTGQIRFLF